MSGDMVLWTVIIAAGLAGVSLLVIGLRGRQVDDHPICRKCGFDLIGLENASEPACPECGAAILGPASLRTGNRARRGRTASLGLVLLALSVVGAGGITWSIHKGFNWNTVKPAWWLAIDAESSDLIAARGALQELTASLGRGELGKSRQAALVERGLRRQADAARPWLTEWGDVIEGVRATGALSPADRSRYLRGMVDMAVSARPRVRRGDDLAAHAGPVLRCGSGTVLACRAILTDVLLGDTPVGPPGTFVLEALCGPRFGAPSGPMFEHPLVPSDLGMPDESRAFGGRDYRLAADVEPGTHALKTTWVITVGAPKAGAGAGGTTGTSTWAPYS